MHESFYQQYATLEDRHWWFIGRRAIVTRAVELAVAGRSNTRVLEVGCGTGGMLQLLGRSSKVFAADVSSTALQFARRRAASSRLVQGDGCRLPFRDESFDLVCAFDVLEHFADDRAALTELRRVCRPDGRLIVSVPAFQALWGQQDVVSHHYRRYRLNEVLERMRDAGFAPTYSTYFNTWLFLVVAIIRLARRIRPTPPDRARSDFETMPPGIVNSFLARLLASEAAAVGRASLPVGVSILSIAAPR